MYSMKCPCASGAALAVSALLSLASASTLTRLSHLGVRSERIRQNQTIKQPFKKPAVYRPKGGYQIVAGCSESSTLLNGFETSEEEPTYYEGDELMSVDLCHHFCSGKAKTIYFGLKDSTCMCFETWTNKEGLCDTPCPGNNNDTCGGNSAFSVHVNYMWHARIKAKSCGPPPNVANAASQCEDGGGESGKTDCDISCAPGYGLAANMLMCDTSTGMWVGHALCNEITCHKPPRILNAMSWCNTGGAVANDGACDVNCMPGNELTKNDLKCVSAGGVGALGAFTGEAICTPKTCGVPSSRDHANFPNVPVAYPNFVTYTCKPGYTFSANALGKTVLYSHCQDNGEFTELNVNEQCQGISCGAEAMVSHGRVLLRPERSTPGDFSVKFGEQVTYTCDRGYSTDGTASGIAAFSVACQDTGHFTPMAACQPLFCGIPPEFRHARAVASTNLTALQYVEDVVKYSTNTGYSLDKEDIHNTDFELNCQYDGYFGGWPAITAVSCGFPAAAENALVAEGEVFYPNFAQYTCVTGHTTTGKAGDTTVVNVECNADRSFGLLPRCRPVECPSRPTIENAAYSSQSTLFYSDIATITCADGYSTSGTEAEGAKTASIQCLANGEFSTPPVCLNIDDCLGRSCGPFGDCVDHLMNYTCNCAAGYEQVWAEDGSELLCGNINDCGPQACGSGGICQDLVEGYTCDCHEGFEILRIGEDTVCEAVVCGMSPSIQHAEVDRGKMSYRDIKTYTCDEGYTLDGRAGGVTSFNVRCEANKEFTGEQHCQPVTCGSPPSLENAGTPVPSTEIVFPEEAVYTCATGYSLTGQAGGPIFQGLKCTGVGRFVAPKPCKPVACGPAPTVRMSLAQHLPLFYGESTSYRCMDGYATDPTQYFQKDFSATCREDSHFIGVEVCHPVRCPMPQVQRSTLFEAHGEVTPDGMALLYPATAGYLCDLGHTLSGLAGGESTFLATCSGAGQLTGVQECHKIVCEEDLEVEHASIHGAAPQEIFFGDVVTYDCAPGYALEAIPGSSERISRFTRECLASGAVTAPEVCENIDDCAAASCGPHGTCVDGIQEYTCDCEPGFELTTRENGALFCGNVDDCGENACGAHGVCIDMVQNYTCECQAGYELVVLNPTDKVCQAKTCPTLPVFEHAHLSTEPVGQPSDEEEVEISFTVHDAEGTYHGDNSNAGALNGYWWQDGERNGKPSFVNAEGGRIMWEVGSDWAVQHMGNAGTPKWTSVVIGHHRYHTEEDTPLPPESGWQPRDQTATGSMTVTFETADDLPEHCTIITEIHPGAGNTVCCPPGMMSYGDGSACQGGGIPNCKLYGNPSLPLCSSVNEHGEAIIWIEHPGKYSGGYANGVSQTFDFLRAKFECRQLGSACKAVTCDTNGGCTVRGSEGLQNSPSGETTYVESVDGYRLMYPDTYCGDSGVLSSSTPAESFPTKSSCEAVCDADPQCTYMMWGWATHDGGYYRCATFSTCPSTERHTYADGDPNVYVKPGDEPQGPTVTMVTVDGGDWTTVDCPSGMRVVGGGCDAKSHPHKMQYNGPDGDHRWKCGGHGGDKKVWAICSADIIPTIQVVNGGDWTTVDCPSGQKIIGGGCNANNHPHKMQYNGPDGDSRWKCGGHGGPKTVWAICTPDLVPTIESVGGGDWTTLNCNDGKKVLGGGCDANNNPWKMQYNAPESSSSWKCGGHGGPKTVWAICADVEEASASLLETRKPQLSVKTSSNKTSSSKTHAAKHMDAKVLRRTARVARSQVAKKRRTVRVHRSHMAAASAKGRHASMLMNMRTRELEISYPTSIHVNCEHGYSIDGSATVTSFAFGVSCLADGSLTPLNQCQPVQCGLAPPVTYTASAPPSDQAFVFGEIAEYTCAEGYTLDGTPNGPSSESSTCGPDGHFEAVRQCEPVMCGHPGAIFHGTVNSEHVSFPAAVTFSCDVGYRFSAGGVTQQPTVALWAKRHHITAEHASRHGYTGTGRNERRRVTTRKGPGVSPVTLAQNLKYKRLNAALSFANAEVLHSNLGGVGPDGGAQELRIGNLGNVGSDAIDIVITTEGEYLKADRSNAINGIRGGFGSVNVRQCATANMNMAFVLHSTGEPVTLDQVTVTFFDLDRGGRAFEKLVTSGYDESYLHEETRVVTQEGGAGSEYESSEDFRGAPNPVDPMALSPEQEMHSVGFMFHDVSSIPATFEVPCTREGSAGRWLMFSFESSMTPPPPQPTPSDQSEVTLGCQASGEIESPPAEFVLPSGELEVMSRAATVALNIGIMDCLQCVRNVCGEPPEIGSATAQPYLYYFGDAVQYHCDAGTTVDGSPEGAATWSVTCQEDGTFSPSPTASCQAPTFTVQGAIADATSMAAIGDVTLTFTRPRGPPETVTTNGQGIYSYRFPTGPITVTASKEGYIESSKQLEVMGDIPSSSGIANLVLSPELPADGWRFVLSWNQDPPDLDTHVYFGRGESCEVWYARRSVQCPNRVIGHLDVDDTTGQGPETSTLEHFGGAGSGRAVFKVYNYYPTADFAASDAVVKVYHGDSQAAEFKVNEGGGVTSGDWWAVFAVNGETGEVTPCTNMSCN